jgi:serine/threonine protein kinase
MYTYTVPTEIKKNNSPNNVKPEIKRETDSPETIRLAQGVMQNRPVLWANDQKREDNVLATEVSATPFASQNQPVLLTNSRKRKYNILSPDVSVNFAAPPPLLKPSSPLVNAGDNAGSFLISEADLGTYYFPLGRGTFGEMYIGRWRNEEVAIKKLYLDKPSEKALEQFRVESEKMARLRSDYIVRVYGYCVLPHCLIVMECLPQGSLYDLLRKEKNLSWSRCYALMMNIAKGLAFLHAANILHGNLKSSNVLLNKNGQAKLSDVGFAYLVKEISIASGEEPVLEGAEASAAVSASFTASASFSSQNSLQAESYVSDLSWMAPELLEEKSQSSQQSDIYALGMVFWEIASGEIPYRDVRSEAAIRKRVKEGRRLPIPADCPQELGALIERCWAQKPADRPSGNDIVAHLTLLENAQRIQPFAPQNQPVLLANDQVGENNILALAVPSPLLKKSSRWLEAGDILDFFVISAADLSVGETLGSGAFGVVYRGQWRYEEVAIKKLLIDKPSKKALEEFRAEGQKMARLHSNYIVQLYGYCASPTYQIVMEYLPHGSLYDLLRADKNLSWSRRYALMMDIAKGLAFLHAANILHRDLKSLNVLLDKNYQAKLSDFGLASLKKEIKLVSDKEPAFQGAKASAVVSALSSASAPLVSQNSEKIEGVVGTLSCMAPELLVEKAQRPLYSQQSDIYALGMVFWEIASGEIPYYHVLNEAVLQAAVKMGNRLPIPQDCPKEIATLIERCWAQKPADRPNANEAVVHLTLLEKDQRFQPPAPVKEEKPQPIQPLSAERLKTIQEDLHAGYRQRAVFIDLWFQDQPLPIDETTFINLAIVTQTGQQEKEAKAQEELKKSKEEKEDKAEKEAKKDGREDMLNSWEFMQQAQEPIAMRDLWLPHKEEKTVPTRLVIDGAAGIGKTTLCGYIARQWIARQLWSDRFEWVVWIPLRNLLDEHRYGAQRVHTLQTLVMAECFPRLKPDEQRSLWETLMAASTQQKVLYLLDGYDEIAGYLKSRPQVAEAVSELLAQTPLILTTRPQAFNHYRVSG